MQPPGRVILIIGFVIKNDNEVKYTVYVAWQQLYWTRIFSFDIITQKSRDEISVHVNKFKFKYANQKKQRNQVVMAFHLICECSIQDNKFLLSREKNMNIIYVIQIRPVYYVPK